MNFEGVGWGLGVRWGQNINTREEFINMGCSPVTQSATP